MFRIKKISQSLKIPTKSYSFDSGWNVMSLEDYALEPGRRHRFMLGFSINGETDKVYIMHGRSSLAINHGIDVIGDIIDAGFESEISIILQNNSDVPFKIHKGDKIGQILIHRTDTSNCLIVDDKLIVQKVKERKHHGLGSSGR